MASWLGATFQLGAMFGSAFVVRKNRATASGGRKEAYRPHIVTAWHGLSRSVDYLGRERASHPLGHSIVEVRERRTLAAAHSAGSHPASTGPLTPPVPAIRVPSHVMVDKIFAVRRTKCGPRVGEIDAAAMLAVSRKLALVTGIAD
jgi:mRNA-degrading endonuclease toxin of MazEF toxin-antitoxin module